GSAKRIPRCAEQRQSGNHPKVADSAGRHERAAASRSPSASETRSVAAATADGEVGSASAIHPNVLLAVAPGASVVAVRVAALPKQAHVAAADMRVAFMTMHNVRRAGDYFDVVCCRLPIGSILGIVAVVAASASAPNLEVGAATMIDPDAAVVVRPI